MRVEDREQRIEDRRWEIGDRLASDDAIHDLRSSIHDPQSSSGHALQLIDAIAERLGEACRLLARRAARLQPITQLIVGDATEVLRHPLHVAHADASFEAFGVLPRIAEFDLIAFDAFDEILGLAVEPFAIPLLAADESSPFAHRPAPVSDQVTVLKTAFGRDLKDRRVRAALDVAHVFVVPVRHQHHDHFQPVQFFRPDEGILNPTPTLFILQLFDALFTTPLEAGVGETAVRLEVFLRPLQRAEFFDLTARDEVGRLDEISDRPGDTRREGLRVHLGAEFGSPFDPVRIMDLHLWVRSRKALFDEGEGRPGRIIPPAYATGEIKIFNRARIRPDYRLADFGSFGGFLFFGTFLFGRFLFLRRR